MCMTFTRMLKAGMVPPPPPDLQGQDLNVELVSVLAQAQRAVASFLASFPLLKLVGSEFVPEPDLSELQVQFKTPVGASLELTQAKARQAEVAHMKLVLTRAAWADAKERRA